MFESSANEAAAIAERREGVVDGGRIVGGVASARRSPPTCVEGLRTRTGET